MPSLWRAPARRVIHTVGPVYHSPERSAPLLRRAYRSSLELANQTGLMSIAFPAISCGVFGYPLDEAARVALPALKKHAGALRELRMALFGRPTWEAWTQVADGLFPAQ